MHILIIPSWYSNYKNPVLGSFFKEQALALQCFGHKVTIAYNEIWPITELGKIKDKAGISFDIEENLRTYRYKGYNFLPKNPLMFQLFNRRMDKLYKHIIKNEGVPDIIHCHSAFWAGISAAYLKNKYNVPLVITEHSSLKHSRYVRGSYIPYIKNCYDSANYIISVSNSLKKELKEYTNNDNMRVIPNMVDLNNFSFNEDKNNSPFTFFSLAFLEKGKGMDTLIRAFHKAFEKSKDVNLIIGGEGSQREGLIKLTEELNIKDKVSLVGALSRNEASKYMKNCNAFVLASQYETFGVVYIEALACGKPIVGTKNGGAEDIIKENNGIIVEVDNVVDLAEALKKIKDNIHNFNGKEISSQCHLNYSPDIIVNNINKVYEEIL